MSIDPPDGPTEVFDFGVGGLLEEVTDATGENTFDHNTLGLVSSATPDLAAQSPVTTTYSYDDAGNESTVTHAGETVTFDQDPASRPETRTEGGVTDTTSYTDLVNPTLTDHATGERDQVVFDSMGRVQTLEHKPSPSAAATLHRRIDYDAQGNLDRVIDLLAPGQPVVADYGYDTHARLTSATRLVDGQSLTTSWTYDAVGNRLTQSRGGATTTYRYSATGQLLSAQQGATGARTAFLYDALGNLERKVAATGDTAYAWDPAGMLSGVTLPDGSTVAFSTDALGQRVSKTSGGATATYLWEKGRLASTKTGASDVSFAYDELGKPLSMTFGGKTYVYRTDERGSVIELTDAATEQAAATYEYDAWGNVLEWTGEEVLLAANPYTWLGAHGVLTDPEVGLYQMGARTYDPEIARFLSPDPAGADSSESSYVYAGNNPTSLMDPTGLFSEGSRFSNYYRYRPRPKPSPPRPKPRPTYRPVYQIRREPVRQQYRPKPRRTSGYVRGRFSVDPKELRYMARRLGPIATPAMTGRCWSCHGRESRAEVLRKVRGFLEGKVRAPRALLGYEARVFRTRWGGRVAVDPRGACSGGPLGRYPHTPVACGKHDLGYDLIRRMLLPYTAKMHVDREFRNDVLRECLARRLGGCRRRAQNAYLGVRIFGKL